MDQATCLFLFLALVSGACSSPLLERQLPQANNTCNLQQDCLQAELRNASVPLSFVDCVSGKCVCRSCFMLNSTGNVCFDQPPCTSFNTTTSQCTDTRRSQLTAFLLAFFLSWTGAANFYINQIPLAVPQLIIGILGCCSCCSCCVGRIFQSWKDKDNDKDNVKCVQAVCMAVLCLPVILIPLIQLAWWIADLVIFARNERPDSRGCFLQPNL